MDKNQSKNLNLKYKSRIILIYIRVNLIIIYKKVIFQNKKANKMSMHRIKIIRELYQNQCYKIRNNFMKSY